MKNFSKQHMFFLSGRKLAELATMEFLRGLGRERFAPTAASHNCPKVVFQMVFPIWFKDYIIEYYIEVDVMLPSLSESSKFCLHTPSQSVLKKLHTRHLHPVKLVESPLERTVQPCQTTRFASDIFTDSTS